MTQNVVNYSDNPTGPELLDNYLDKDQENILTCNAGVQRPSYATQGTFWLDTSTTPWTYKMYDGSSDCKVGTFNSTSHKFNAYIETLTNNLTLTNNTISYRHIYSDNSSITKGTIPSSNSGADFVFRDSASSIIGAFSTWYNEVGSTRASMRAYDPVAGSSTAADFVITNYANGSARLNFTTSDNVNNTSMYGVSNSNNDSVVPTKGWVNNPATSTNVVHRSGNETITGNKTFIDKLIHFKTDIAYNETPLANKYGGFNFLDKNDSEISSFYTGLYTNDTGLSGFNLKNKSGDSARLTLRYNASGIFYTEAPTPSVSDNSTKITTTAYINNKFKKVSTLPANPDADTFYYIPE